MRLATRSFSIALVALALAHLSACDKAPQGTAQAVPVEVEVVTLHAADVPLTTELPGRTTAHRKAEIRPQVNGIILKRLFEEGAQITAGQQLYQIDDATYKAALATAQAQLAEAQASFNAAEAREARYKKLLAAKAVSQQDYEDALAALGQRAAGIQAAKAAVETARINLEYTKVLAPIDGRIGKSSVTEGALVTAGQAQALAVIQQLDPIYVDVSQSAGNLLSLRRQILEGDLVADERPPVRLRLGDGTFYDYAGTLEFSEVDVNESTGTVVLRALFPNPDYLLLPGMFVRAEIEEGRKPDALLIPQRAVSHNRQGAATTLVVNDAGTVEARELQTSRAIGDSWLVTGGLQSGEQVIVAGVQKAPPGTSVKVVDVSKPSATKPSDRTGPATAQAPNTASADREG